MTPATLIETLARHPLHNAPLEVSFGTTANGERTLRLWAQLDRAVRAWPDVARDVAASLRSAGVGGDGQLDYSGQSAAQTIEWACIGAGILA